MLVSTASWGQVERELSASWARVESELSAARQLRSECSDELSAARDFYRWPLGNFHKHELTAVRVFDQLARDERRSFLARGSIFCPDLKEIPLQGTILKKLRAHFGEKVCWSTSVLNRGSTVPKGIAPRKYVWICHVTSQVCKVRIFSEGVFHWSNYHRSLSNVWDFSVEVPYFQARLVVH